MSQHVRKLSVLVLAKASGLVFVDIVDDQAMSTVCSAEGPSDVVVNYAATVLRRELERDVLEQQACAARERIERACAEHVADVFDAREKFGNGPGLKRCVRCDRWMREGKS